MLAAARRHWRYCHRCAAENDVTSVWVADRYRPRRKTRFDCGICQRNESEGTRAVPDAIASIASRQRLRPIPMTSPAYLLAY